MTAELIATLVANTGAFGLVVWLVRRTYTHTIPRLADSYDKNLKAIQETFVQLLADQRSDFLLAIREQREQFREELRAMRASK